MRSFSGSKSDLIASMAGRTLPPRTWFSPVSPSQSPLSRTQPSMACTSTGSGWPRLEVTDNHLVEQGLPRRPFQADQAIRRRGLDGHELREPLLGAVELAQGLQDLRASMDTSRPPAGSSSRTSPRESRPPVGGSRPRCRLR